MFVDAENARICSVLSKYDRTVIIFICVYMPNDINCNIYEYNEVLSAIHMLQSLYTPHYIICGGDWNTDFTRKTSLLTKSLVSFCDYEGLTCVNLVSNAQQFTYVSDMNGSKSLIDHFIISDNLLNYANTSDVRDDIDNHSDHLPITMYLHISIPMKRFLK